MQCTTSRGTHDLAPDAPTFDRGTFAVAGVGLVIQIVTGDPRPIFRQIVDGLRLQIASGDLAAGTQLPSVRGLAMQLTVNPNTVAKAYAQLTADGLIASQKGVGVFVSELRQTLSPAERRHRLEEATRRFVGSVASLGLCSEEILEHVSQELRPLDSASDRRSVDPHQED